MRSASLLAVALVAATAIAPPARAQEAGDPAAGQRLFNQCRVCHTIDNNGRNGVGPNLYGVVGRRAASIEGFRYSANMRSLGEGGYTWSEDNLRAYLRNPKEVVPQGIMAFPGFRANEQNASDVIAYLRAQRG